MLKDLYPKAYHSYLALPLLGSIVEQFDDWLIELGYRRNTRKIYIHQTAIIDHYIQKQGRYRLDELTPKDLHACWLSHRPCNVHAAGTTRVLQKFLEYRGLLPGLPVAEPPTPVCSYLNAYRVYLEEVRGLAPRTIYGHLLTASQFLDHLEDNQASLEFIKLNRNDVEDFVSRAGKKYSRGTLQHVVAQLRCFLRFLTTTGHIPTGLDLQIDTPRLYRQEQLPHSLGWETVRAFLDSIDRETPIGLRDYAMFFLMASYGLRNCDIAALKLDDIHWQSEEIRIVQRKTGYPLILPLTDAVGTVLLHYLRHARPRSHFRQLFLTSKAPVGPLGYTAVSDAFSARVNSSGLSIPFRGSHCLRHSYAVHLLRQGTSLKTLGDLLGHRTAESTCVYLRLAIDDLREVPLAVPQVVPQPNSQEERS